MSSQARIIEVGPRDGLQNEATHLDINTRVEFVQKLSDAGVRNIEAGAFVSPKWVPQMAGSREVLTVLREKQKLKELASSLNLMALVPNLQGFEESLISDVKEVAVFTAASETFSKKNTNASIAESLKRVTDVIGAAKKKKIKVRGYISTCFYCPFEGRVKEAVVVRLADKLMKMGVYEVSIGDTIGAATPKEVRSLNKKLISTIGRKNIAMHMHDTRGTALANILASLDLGITTFDSSLGGLGGCPYAPGAAGNVATEDVVYMLHGMGVKTGIDLAKLNEVNSWMSQKLGKKLRGAKSRT